MQLTLSELKKVREFAARYPAARGSSAACWVTPEKRVQIRCDANGVWIVPDTTVELTDESDQSIPRQDVGNPG